MLVAIVRMDIRIRCFITDLSFENCKIIIN